MATLMATCTERPEVKMREPRFEGGGEVMFEMVTCPHHYSWSLCSHSPLMRPRHTQHSLSGFPIHSVAFVAPNDIVIGGGGGSSKSGVKNKLVWIQLNYPVHRNSTSLTAVVLYRLGHVYGSQEWDRSGRCPNEYGRRPWGRHWSLRMPGSY